MAKKCFSCDYPYVPSGGICPNCGKDNSDTSSAIPDGCLKYIYILFGLFLLYLVVYHCYLVPWTGPGIFESIWQILG